MKSTFSNQTKSQVPKPAILCPHSMPFFIMFPEPEMSSSYHLTLGCKLKASHWCQPHPERVKYSPPPAGHIEGSLAALLILYEGVC